MKRSNAFKMEAYVACTVAHLLKHFDYGFKKLEKYKEKYL